MTEFKLNDYIQTAGLASYIPTGKVKEFIKLLTNDILLLVNKWGYKGASKECEEDFINTINKRAGKELVEGGVSG